MILALDVGNTNIEIGVLFNEPANYQVNHSIRFFTRLNITSDELALFILNFLKIKEINPKQIKSMIFSSVVPPLNGRIKDMFCDYFNSDIIEVNDKIDIGIVNCYKNPKEVGSDRLVNASGIYKLYKKNAIIVDMGTATTLDVLTNDGKYIGGAIVPGILTATQALTEKASRLPAISIQKKEYLLTDNTAESIEAGVYFSNYYAMTGMIQKLAQEVGFKDYLKVGTGGFSRIFAYDNIFDIIDYSLSLKGLKVIYDLNKFAYC
ncbi:MAG: hypothetical protein A2086_06155 [Spirochaetes bacterium GWD1_27_9]|nr:MAG: hypothetical protein A2Z98_16810 [Spirochaetes bacterium GWB1_27_13]OHD27838.1 MAG: hypothetical protein A2Y34_15550 [Spirochaetes bacterium GWC1_27_15]OHD30850.1 MAG: hypothetical protein A2086_06155 [Spirochaetes bacterium GWD1_27_9]